MRSIALFVPAALAVVGVSCAGVTSRPTQTSVSDVRYEIVADSASLARSAFRVVMTFRVSSAGPVRLALPAWLPGAYEVARFARHVGGFGAEADGVALEWRRAGVQEWEVTPRRAGEVRVAFDYAVRGIHESNASATREFLYFSGAPFLYLVDRPFDWPARVTVRTESAWRVVTDLAEGAGARTFTATDYHDLVDAPFFIGRFDLDSTRLGSRWLRFAAHPVGTLTPARHAATARLFEELIAEDSAIFGDVPFGDYTVLLLADSTTQGGGIEHLDSQVSAIRAPLVDTRDLRMIYSHELLHAWNVKRLRPREMTPYRYDGPQPSEMLWVSEGVTEYYAAMTLARRHPADSAITREYLARWIFMTEASPEVSLSDASIATWVDGPGINYMKGPLAAMLIDIMIRDETNNARSLDDALRALYKKAATKDGAFTKDDWWSTIIATTNTPTARERFESFARTHIDGRTPFPIDSILALAALRVERSTTPDARYPSGTRKTLRVLPMRDAPATALRIREGMRSK